jgi:molybdopterin converting factor small subunit
LRAVQVKVLFYGGLKHESGALERVLELPQASTVGGLLERLKRENPRLASQLDVTAAAVGDQIVDEDYAIQDGDEIALLPPVSGG